MSSLVKVPLSALLAAPYEPALDGPRLRIPGTLYAAIMAAIGLHTAVPKTIRMGVNTFRHLCTVAQLPQDEIDAIVDSLEQDYE